MNSQQNNPFEKIQQNSSLNPADIYKISESVKGANFSDDKTVRRLVRQLSQMTNKPLSKEKEDKLVQAITNNNVPGDMQSLKKMFKR